MTTTEHTPPRFDDDAQIQAWVHRLLQGPNRRQVWAFFLDEDGVQIGPLMPCEDLPIDPDEPFETEQRGMTTAVTAVADLLAMVQSHFTFAQVVLVWERHGTEVLTHEEKAWARQLARGIGDGGGRVRAQFLLHSRGMRQLGPDDLS